MTSKAIIIGSGISGLTAATLLSARGYEVTILERRKAVGGALQRFKKRNVDFDVGFHYTGGLGEGEILTRLWRYLGIMDAIPASPFPEKAADCVCFHDSELRARAFFSYSRIREELFTLFPEERQAIEDFFTLMHNLGDSMACYNFREELTPFLQSMAFPEKTTLGHYLRSHIRNPQLQAILSLPVFLHGVDPDRIGLSMHASVAHCVYSGMYSIKGGGRSIINALTAKLTSHGAVTHCDQEVDEIILENGRAVGVATKEAEFHAPVIIYTGHPAYLTDLTPRSSFSKAYRNRLSSLQNTDSMLIVFGSLPRERVESLSLFSNHYGISSGLDVFSAKLSTEKLNFFLSSCGAHDTEQLNGSPSDSTAVALMRPASWNEVEKFDRGSHAKRATGYNDWKSREAARLLSSAGQYLPELKDTFNTITISSPLTFRDELSYPRGAVYGVKHGNDQFQVESRTKIPGLFLSGQNILMPGLIGASLAAVITVGNIVGLEPLWREIVQCG